MLHIYSGFPQPFGKYMDLQLSIRYALVCHIFGFVISINKQQNVQYLIFLTFYILFSPYPFTFGLFFHFGQFIYNH